jgi:hypothetical protein
MSNSSYIQSTRCNISGNLHMEITISNIDNVKFVKDEIKGRKQKMEVNKYNINLPYTRKELFLSSSREKW